MSGQLKKIISIAKGAGEILLGYYSREYEITNKFHDPKILLTTADLESEKYLIKELSSQFSDYKIISEEMAEDVLKNQSDESRKVFLVDPLDGTRQFVKHGENFSVNIGVLLEGVPVLGVLHLPLKKMTFFAEKGRGAFLEENGSVKKLHVSKIADLKGAKVFQQEPHHAGSQSELLKKVEGKFVDQDSATGFKLCSITIGEGDVFINTSQHTSKWDVCASEVILTEAGGELTDFSGSPMDYSLPKGEIDRHFFATNGYLHQAVLDLIAKNKF